MSYIDDPIRYGFAVGRVRVLESRLLNASHFERLLDAPAFEDQRRVLSETHFGRYLEGVTTADGVEAALDASLGDLFDDFLDHADLPESIVAFFRRPYDWANLKARLKAEAFATSTEGLLQDLGSVEPEAFAGSGDGLPDWLREVEELVRLSTVEGPLDPLTVELTVDREAIRDRMAQAKASRSKFLRRLAGLETDCANARALLRSRLAGAPLASARQWLVDDGLTTPEVLAAAYDDSIENVASSIAALPAFAGAEAAGLADAATIDSVLGGVVTRFLKASASMSAGPEPVVAYVMARIAEVRIVRTLLIGRMVGTPAERLRARVRLAVA